MSWLPNTNPHPRGTRPHDSFEHTHGVNNPHNQTSDAMGNFSGAGNIGSNRGSAPAPTPSSSGSSSVTGNTGGYDTNFGGGSGISYGGYVHRRSDKFMEAVEKILGGVSILGLFIGAGITLDDGSNAFTAAGKAYMLPYNLFAGSEKSAGPPDVVGMIAAAPIGLPLGWGALWGSSMVWAVKYFSGNTHAANDGHISSRYALASPPASSFANANYQTVQRLRLNPDSAMGSSRPVGTPKNLALA